MLTAADKPVPVLLHEADAGQPCLVCEGECPGLEIHFWRKICINCKCPVSDHQAPTTQQPLDQVKRGKQLEDNIRAQFECGKYSWIPVGLSSTLVEEYMKQLPPEQRPLVGSVGEQYRRKLLMTQLPAHDHTPNEGLCRAQAEELAEFSRLRYEMSHGVGTVRPVTSQEADMFDCRTCQSPLVADQLGVVTERAGPACIWCVGCFKCDVCQDPLVDLHYFYKDGELFCGRHHAELLKPRCFACDELILAKEYTLAEDRNWHMDHFCCWECDSPLGGQRYVTRDDHPFCILCYEELFAPPCKKCSLPIGLDSAHMVHREFHWHATESCFYCENCQVSLISSPFLFKFEEIFCSSTCAQQYAVHQLSEDTPPKHPQIEVVEDNPVDRSRVQSILRKESSPSPPKENGLQHKKVMFDVSRDTELEVEVHCTSEITRTHSEEEFEYLEKSLIEHTVVEEQCEGYIETPEDMIPPEKESPISVSSYSESPMSEEPEHSEMFGGEVDLELEEENIGKPAVTELEISLSDAEDAEVDIDLSVTDETKHCDDEVVNDLDDDDDSLSNDVMRNDTNLDVLENDTSYEEIISAVENMVNPDEVVIVEQTNQIDPDQINQIDTEHTYQIDPEELDEGEESSELPRTPEIVITDPISFNNGNLDDEPVEVNSEEVETSPVEEKAESIEPVVVEEKPVFVEGKSEGEEKSREEEKPELIVEETVETVEEKENHPQMVRTRSNNDLEDLKPPRKPARNKLSSASFNRVLRKIDHTSNETIFLERPGKRLKNRPRSMSSLNSHNRPQNTLEQKENLVSMYALAPDIADMVASVYQNQHSISTTTQILPERDENRTLGASPVSCATGTPRTGIRRNPSYEAAEFVMHDVESEGESEAEEQETLPLKQTSLVPDSNPETAATEDLPVKSPKKGIKQRLSFKKKKEKGSTPQKANLKGLPPGEPEKRRTKKQCVLM
ncbi:hypothetical protein ACHWQZ_G010606 [Mnemiopsis leidyi]